MSIASKTCLSRAFFKQWKFNVFLIRSRFNLFSDYLKTVFTGRFNLISLYNILKIWREKNYISETLRHVLYVFWDWNNAVGCMDIEYFLCVQYKPITPASMLREREREWERRRERERNINMFKHDSMRHHKDLTFWHGVLQHKSSDQHKFYQSLFSYQSLSDLYIYMLTWLIYIQEQMSNLVTFVTNHCPKLSL